MSIDFVYNTDFELSNKKHVSDWVLRVVSSHGYKVDEIVYAFFNDEDLKELNIKFLNHDYYTDVISFDARDFNDIKVNIIDGVDGCFQLLNVLSNDECDQFVHITDNILGYTQDAPVSLPYNIRHMSNCNWIVDDNICDTIFNRCRPWLPQIITRSDKDKDIVNTLGDESQTVDSLGIADKELYALFGLNNRFRFYRYSEGDYFKPHTDGSWPHSKIVNGQFMDDAYNDGSESAMTFLILLSDDYKGGETVFYNRFDKNKQVEVRTPKGGVIIFFHGMHDLHMLHEGKLIEQGLKYMIRTELIFEGY